MSATSALLQTPSLQHVHYAYGIMRLMHQFVCLIPGLIRIRVYGTAQPVTFAALAQLLTLDQAEFGNNPMEAVRAFHRFPPGPLLAVHCSSNKRLPCSHRLQATSLARPTLSNLHRTGHVSAPRDELCRPGRPKARSGNVAARAQVDEQSKPDTEAAKLVLCLRSELGSLKTQQLSAVSSAAITQLTALCQGGRDNEVVEALGQVQSCLQHKVPFVITCLNT